MVLSIINPLVPLHIMDLSSSPTLFMTDETLAVILISERLGIDDHYGYRA
jgi:hypothetical protein